MSEKKTQRGMTSLEYNKGLKIDVNPGSHNHPLGLVQRVKQHQLTGTTVKACEDVRVKFGEKAAE